MRSLPPRPSDSGRRRRTRIVRVFAVVATTFVAGWVLIAQTRNPAVSQTGSSTAVGSAAPNGTFTALNGTHITIADLKGVPLMLWFVSGGCASCAASIPVVAQHLNRITGDGVRVVTLGLYGAFPPGRRGLSYLSNFGKAVAGTRFPQPGWTWGRASKKLSEVYDPSGTPDVYTLINGYGQIRYRNSVPLSTMNNLLHAAGQLAVHN